VIVIAVRRNKILPQQRVEFRLRLHKVVFITLIVDKIDTKLLLGCRLKRLDFLSGAERAAVRDSLWKPSIQNRRKGLAGWQEQDETGEQHQGELMTTRRESGIEKMRVQN